MSSRAEAAIRALRSVWLHEDLNFLLTNRIPRLTATRFMGWFASIQSPWICRLSIAVWRLFADLDFSESKKSTFNSLRDCFTRELKEGTRPLDLRSEVIVSPCDGIVGASGCIVRGSLWQAKGLTYSAEELMGSAPLAETFEGGSFVTLRLTSAMYHRFHAPHDAVIETVDHIHGDTWNVNPIALKRIERLFCRNERAVMKMKLKRDGKSLALIPVGAILVASIRLHCLDLVVGPRYRGPVRHTPSAEVNKGQELGWFEHGSTIIVMAPPGVRLVPWIQEGTRVKAGEALMLLYA